MADFQENISEFDARNVALLGASVDSEEDAKWVVDELGLTYPMIYDLDYMEFATKTGAFYEVRRSIIHATSFTIQSDGHVLGAVYSTSQIGRYQAIDSLRVIDFLNRQKNR